MIKQNAANEFDELVKAYDSVPKAWEGNTRLKSSGEQLTAVTEPTMYQADFPIFLKEQLRGRTVIAVAELLDVPEEHVVKLLEGQWRPSKAICEKMALKTVYAITRPGLAAQRSKSRSRTQS